MTANRTEVQKTEKKRLDIRTTLFLYLAVFCLVVLLVIWLVQGFLIDHIYYGLSVDRMDRVTNELADIALSPQDRDAVRALSVKHQANVEIYYREGGELGALFLQASGDVGNALIRPDAIDKRALCREAYEANGATETTCLVRYTIGHPMSEVLETVESRRLVIVRLLMNREGRELAIFFDCHLEPVGTAAEVLSFELLLLSAVLILAASILAYVVSRRIARPIAEINESAKELAAGHYEVSFGPGGYREIDELSATLTYAAAELAKVEELQKELIANISHDLRTPLTMIIGYGEVMRDIEGENTPQNIGVIIDEAKRLSELVNDLLLLSRCRAGCEELVTEEFDMGTAVAETVERYRQMLASRGFVFTGKTAKGLTVCADRGKILQVMYNLINNAVNYSGDSREITVNCYATEVGGVRFEVIDRGTGIPQEELTDIWERYYKAHGEHKRSVVGSGLGLSIVRGILELHRARYGVDSRVGEGSRFWFELPPRDAFVTE